MLLLSKRVTYYFVYLPTVECHLFYLSRRKKYRAGDRVMVPYGWANRVVPGVVIWSREFSRTNLPLPVEKTKFIIGEAPSDQPSQRAFQPVCFSCTDRRA